MCFLCPVTCNAHCTGVAGNMSGVPVEKALQFVSSCCSSGSAGGQWGFGNEVTQLSCGRKQGVLGMES